MLTFKKQNKTKKNQQKTPCMYNSSFFILAVEWSIFISILTIDVIGRSKLNGLVA